FNIEIKDKKGAENLAAYHLSRLENPDLGVLTEKEIVDEFLDEHLMILKAKLNDNEPWLCLDNVMRRCVAGSEILKILAHCHSGPTGGIIALQLLEGRFTNQDSFSLISLRMLNIRFGVPKALISDRGTHFCNFQLERALQKYGVTHKLSMTYHPQTNGKIKVINKTVKRILERSIGYNPKDWSKKLNDALWAFRTAYKTPTGSKNRFMELNELIKLRYGAYENTRIYKERTKKWHDSRLRRDKDFKVGDEVLLFNSCLRMHPGKLKSKWYGPNVVKTVYPYGAVEIIDKNGFSFKVNGQRLKKYYGGHIEGEDDEVIEFEGDKT
ncbi:reverse transcriptase domain-containing protein, partial [Tanacetum coccineum]